MTEHKTLVKNIFDRASFGYGEKGCSFFDYFGEKLVALVRPTAGNQILDVATGKGAVLFPAARLVGHQGSAIGVDLSPRMIEEATKRARFPWIELHQMDAEHLLFPDHSFDIVFCAFALFFFPHIAQALSECRRVLKPKGRLAVSTFGKKSSLHAWVAERAKELGASLELGVTTLDSGDALREQLVSAGFTHVEIHEESKVFWHENAEEWWSSLWTHAVRSRFEQLSPQNLERLKKEALLKAKTGRVSDERHAFYAIAKL
jgi:ubiquinone/menaquinone biosynthesis C-methylase UbiE